MFPFLQAMHKWGSTRGWALLMVLSLFATHFSVNAPIEAARQGGFAGLLVKANRDAQRFFSAKGLQQLSVMDAWRDYPYQENGRRNGIKHR